MNFYSFPNGPINPFQAKARATALCRAWRGFTVLLLAFGLALVFLSPAAAADGALDPSFITGPGPYAGVQNIPELRAPFSYPTGSTSGVNWPYNGYQLLFGSFYGMTVGSSNWQNYNCICRLNSTGALDTSFVSNQINSEIRGVYIYPHNDPNYPDKILIWGSFNATPQGVNGQGYVNFARLNANGSMDTTFPMTIQWGGAVNTAAVLGSGASAKILLGGYNIRVGNEDGPMYNLLRLNFDGSLDSGFTPWGTPGGYISGIRPGDPAPNDVRVFCTYPKNPDGSGGVYYMVVVDTATLNIASPLAFIGDETVDGPIFNLVKQSDGNSVICGEFKNYYNTATSSWVPSHHVARLGLDQKTLDPTYDVGVGPNGVVTQVAPMMGNSPYDDRMLVVGNFTTWNGNPCGYIMRLKTDGSVDPSFTPGTGADDRIRNMIWNVNGTGGTIAGYFRSYNGATNLRGGIAALNPDGSLSTSSYTNVTPQAGNSGTVYSLATQSDGKIIIGGDFNGVCGKYRQGFARLNPNGSLDTSFKGGVDGLVQSVALQADGKILLGGQFGQCQSYACTGLARLNLDDSLDTTFKPMVLNGPAWGSVNQVVPLANGQMMIAGDFYNDTDGCSLARLNSNGTRDPNFDAKQFSIPGTDWFDFHRLAVAGSNYLIAGGWDTSTTMSGGGFLARLTNSGALDTGFYPGSNSHIQTMDGGVEDLLLQPDGQIVVSGSFSHITDGTVNPARPAIARFSANGLLDSTFTPSLTPPTGANAITISAMAGQPNGKILIEENFFNNSGNNNYNYVSTQVARLNSNGSLDGSFAIGKATNGWYNVFYANSILRLPNGKALIGGNFSQYNGTAAWSLVRIFAGPANFSPGDLLLLLE